MYFEIYFPTDLLKSPNNLYVDLMTGILIIFVILYIAIYVYLHVVITRRPEQNSLSGLVETLLCHYVTML